ncbi:hypothetical protein AJ79_07070 [Helicocarpus griseus UAMH5409]|uniref:F-box domain-containing protein n=1 Tax=Helicocarpus griseus UAMH5409 TaxID=1447875 RepID=A0A2B7WYX6_9EURO|nr:hypothetical protein AJ79_07070 [Helicocarpus griseus UAMH5409]
MTLNKSSLSPRLLDLPVEILCLIMNHLGPEDLVALIEGRMVLVSVITTKHCSAQNAEGMTILQLIARKERQEWMDMLVSRCANLSPRNHLYQTPLFLAVKEGNEPVVDMFLAAGAPVSVYSGTEHDDRRTSPLVAAVEVGNSAIIQMLLDKGANVAEEDSEGGQALWYAARHGHADAVQLLIENGADMVDAGKKFCYSIVCRRLRVPYRSHPGANEERIQLFDSGC